MSEKFVILSLSGGGIRGVFQARFLNILKKEIINELNKENKSFKDLFNLICGTSTGSIIGSAVAIDKDLQKIENLYEILGSEIFEKPDHYKKVDEKLETLENNKPLKFLRLIGLYYLKKKFDLDLNIKSFPNLASYIYPFTKGPKYTENRQKMLEEALIENLGEIYLNDINTNLLITATGINPYYTSKIFTNFNTSAKNSKSVLLHQAIMASTAAPTYFLPYKVDNDSREFIDGGLWNNNPSFLAIGYAVRLQYNERNINSKEFKNIYLLSIGTGKTKKKKSYKYFANMRPVEGAKTIIDIMFDSQDDYVMSMVKDLLPSKNIIEVNPVIDEFELDDKQAIVDLKQHVDQEISGKLDDIKTMLLKNYEPKRTKWSTAS